MEPDLRCSESQPLFVEVGLQSLCECGLRDGIFAHTLLGATRLADFHPDEVVREKLFRIIADRLPSARFFIPYAPVNTYGLTPLHFAPSPDSKWMKLFTDEQINGHLTDLAGRQQEDGGWPISWDAPGNASVCEWRGRWTLDAVKVLSKYGRLE